MKRMYKFISFVMSSVLILMAIILSFNNTVKASDMDVVCSESQVVLDINENYLKDGYYDDVIYQDTFSVPIIMNDETKSTATQQMSTATLNIHYNKTRGAWLSLLIEVHEQTRRSLIESVSGVFKHREFGYPWNEVPFSNPVLYDRWIVNTEYDLGKDYNSGEQIHAQVVASAKLREGYIPQFTRTAIATIP